MGDLEVDRACRGEHRNRHARGAGDFSVPSQPLSHGNTQHGIADVDCGHVHGHVVVEDLNREVLACLSENLALLLPDDRPRAVMWVDDLVADVEQEDLPDVAIRCLHEKRAGKVFLPAIRSHNSAFFTGG